MTSGRPGPPGEEAWRLSRGFDNQATDVQGNVVQAGSIDGGVHIHNYYAEPSRPAEPPPSHFPPPAGPPLAMPPPVMPLSAASPVSPPFGMPAAIPFALPARPRRQWPGKVGRWCGEWLLSLAPIFALSVVPAGVGFAIAGDDSVWARLIGFGIGLAVVSVIGLAWWLVSRRRSRLSPPMFVLWALDRLAFKRLGTTGTHWLWVIIASCLVEVLGGMAQQPQPSTNGGVAHPAFAIVFSALLALVAARRLKRGS